MRHRFLVYLRAAAVALAVVVGGLALGSGVAPVSAQEQTPSDELAPSPVDPGFVVVLKVSGFIDPVLADYIVTEIQEASDAGAVAVVVQMNSGGAVISDEELEVVARALRDSAAPVGIWIGPSGSQALGGAAELVGVVPVVGMAPNTRLGRIGEQRLAGDEFGPIFDDHTAALLEETVNDEEALAQGVIPRFDPVVIPDGAGDVLVVEGAPLIGDFIINLDGVTSREIVVGDQIRREPVTVTIFNPPSLLDQLAHTVASPAVTYLLLVVGLSLLVFELYTAGIGIAGVVGATCVVMSGYGLGVLPARGWAVALMVVAFFGFAVDVQAGVPRVWTAIGLFSFSVASLALFDGLSMSWVTLVAALVGVVLTFYSGMPTMVRTRFSTPTIGREWMEGEEGEAVNALSPDGVVRVRDSLWRAYTNRATPIDEGDGVRVVGITGLLLEVEPLDGAARDYRER